MWLYCACRVNGTLCSRLLDAGNGRAVCRATVGSPPKLHHREKVRLVRLVGLLERLVSPVCYDGKPTRNEVRTTCAITVSLNPILRQAFGMDD